ncbi:MAG: aspartate aminotransferase family protein [Elusimicrobia bacterium]|nr:aspartate aminotransferase family protein [Elusimicrobiota bacterium]
MTKTDAMLLEDKYVLPTYGRFPFVVAGGKGHFVRDDKGVEYLDLYGGHAVALLGHCPEPVVSAVRAQADVLLFYSNLVYSSVRTRAAAALIELCAAKDAQVFFCNSGTEANEAALRVARLVTGRPKVVATYGSFHGRTAGSLAATGIAKYKHAMTSAESDTVHVRFGDLKAAKAALRRDAAAFILEPIQSMSGIVMPPRGYLKGLEKLCRKSGAVLIFDEVQTGLGRLGAPSAAQAFRVKPGVQSFAKALASGVPCGAIVIAPELVHKLQPGALGSTFGGGPLACAAVEATIRTIIKGRLWRKAKALEARFRAKLKHPALKEIRGKGLLLGLVLDRPARELRDHLVERRILTGLAEDPNVLRLLPPLTIGEAEVDRLAAALKEYK